jgi:D-alanyl-D-alanine carboxypeptidase
MRRAQFLQLLLGGVALSAGSRRSAVAAIDESDPGAGLAAIRKRYGIPGMAALALRGDQIAGQFVAGVRKLNGADRVTPADRFHLGSETKAMTATLVALLVAEGKLQWTTTLGEIFSASGRNMAPGWKNVTLHQILGHRAGFPRHSGAAERQRNARTAPVAALRREFAATVLAVAPQSPPGTKFEYSNTGYIVVGAALEQIMGTTWEELIQQRLFAPLGIKTGGFGAPGTPGQTNQPWGHRANGAAIDPGSPEADNPRIYGPTGTVHMAMGDWAKFIALHLRGDPANPQRQATLLSADAFAHLHAPVDGERFGYACGWGVMQRPWAKGESAGAIGRVLNHGGSNTLWLCVAWVAPEIDFAALVCCNRVGDNAAKACDDAAGLLIRKFAKS